MSGTGAGDTPHPVIHRNSLREQIAGALREEMMAGRLEAGRNFTVKEIAELYGVSATPAREALVDLGAQGLLRAEHHRGFTVPELCWEDFLEVFEARVLLTDSFSMATFTTDQNRSLRLRLNGEAVDGWQLVALEPRQATVIGPSGSQVLELATFNGQGGEPPTVLRGANGAVPPAGVVPPPPPPPAAAAASNARPGPDVASAAAASANAPSPAAPANNGPSEAQMQAIRERIQARRRQLQQQQQQPSPPPGDGTNR